jgi:transcriptional regulator GlxA family with amidase domain
MRLAFFLLYPGFEIIDFSGALQPLDEAREFGLEIELKPCSESETALSEQGVLVAALAPLPEFRAGDWIFVPGCTLEHTAVPRWLASALRDANRAGSRILSTCTGAFALGEAGLLDGRCCATHWKRLDELARRFPKAKVLSDRLFAEDRGVVTGGGRPAASASPHTSSRR